MPQPQLQVPSPYVVGSHVQPGGTSQRVLSSAAIEDGQGLFAQEPGAVQESQLETLAPAQSGSAAPQPQSHELPSP